MARLNEPPVAPAAANIAAGTSTESIDALKRRFIRQNRELAKNNSSQSLRIRSLELEVSKLLADNLGLREQNLALQNEVHNARKQASSMAVRRMKCDLREKLAELSGLIDGLDEEEVTEERSSVEKERILSPSQRQYRERQPLAELMQETVMPTIAEDKQYPRRTLGADEIRAIRLSDQSGASGSPDIGPPPVAHFDCEDPAKTDGSQAPPQTSPKPAEEELLPSINLDTRRRRRDSHSKLEIRRHSILAQSPVKSEGDAVTTTMLRTGAKRKLADRETEKPIKPPSKGDFTFSRRASTTQTSSDEEKAPVKDDIKAQGEVNDERPVSPAKPARKVLGEKSVNTSPKKRIARTDKPPKDDLEKPAPRLNAPKERPPSRSRRISAIPLPSPPAEEIAPTIELRPPEPSTTEQLQPYTPALADDIFSPTSEEPLGGGACDTPPPGDLSSLSNTTESGQRPSRRARSAVNYAEPSLIAKMRRPGKQMVDAVTGLQDPKRAMNPKDQQQLRDRKSTSAPQSVSVKKEPVDDDDDEVGDCKTSKDENETPQLVVVGEGSPLRSKSTDSHPPATQTTEEASAPAPTQRRAPSSTSSSSTTRKRRETASVSFLPPGPPRTETEDAAKKMEELDLYDFKSSSPPPPSEEGLVEEAGKGVGVSVGKGQRRHSMAPRKEVGVSRTSTAAAVGGNASGSGSGRAASRRRSMML
ncbi:hypothetical protein M409DRAFT_27954 [Zasmidium cellare ATCC 36951]|uniref:Shugoshin C-terminal domain-containing protein n=1 Tax=Zasmidium cellare ATCC 36951 TaxID=1080233 RepID=A0A6A6C823_ZASCE|nr:uncharacterized protein M409DRAFT_27954 [Zasmidium cellare ATCC 36951]KAF2161556.1 hypothetical protein M409DRAFT_27954 [Zasmidium cellare ATCC 36951]